MPKNKIFSSEPQKEAESKRTTRGETKATSRAWKPTEEIEYIDGKIQKGIKIDWNKVKKRFDELDIPEEFLVWSNPLSNPLVPQKCGYILNISQRGMAKTTNVLLAGLICYAMYGVNTCYVRTDERDLQKSNALNLYDVVIENKYIEKIFGDAYNSIFLRGGKWYLCRVDEDGNIIAKNPDPTCYLLAVDKAPKYKSVLNLPRGDFVVWDECIKPQGFSRYNEFGMFADLVSTIMRKRVSGNVWMLCNSLSRDAALFSEMLIHDAIREMSPGESRVVETTGGTHIYIKIYGADNSPQRAETNRRFFGFDDNPNLYAIMGKGNSIWAEDSYPHIPEDNAEYLARNIFVKSVGKTVQLNLVSNEKFGLCVYVVPYTKEPKEDAYIFTDNFLSDSREILFMGYGSKLGTAIWRDLYQAGKFFYAKNSEGDFIVNYIKRCAEKRHAKMM